MTSRDLLFWLQGALELGLKLGPEHEQMIIDHADLVLLAEPKSEITIAIKALAKQPEALKAVVQAQFLHVIDHTWKVSPDKDPAHKLPKLLQQPNPPWYNTDPSNKLIKC